jgi:hypothetical protein
MAIVMLIVLVTGRRASVKNQRRDFNVKSGFSRTAPPVLLPVIERS